MRIERKVYIQAWQRYPAFNARARQGMVLPPVAPKKAIVGFKLAMVSVSVSVSYQLRVCMWSGRGAEAEVGSELAIGTDLKLK